MPDRTQDLTNHRKVATACKNYIDKKIDDLKWELGSHTLDVESDTTTAYIKTVPTGTIGCQINKVGGMSYKYNQLAEKKNTTSTIGDLTITSDNYNFVVNGEQSSAIGDVTSNFLYKQLSIPSGHKILMGIPTNNAGITSYEYYTQNFGNAVNGYYIITVGAQNIAQIRPCFVGTFNNVKFFANIFDLTALGIDTTDVATAKSSLLAMGINVDEYNTGSIRDTAVTSVVSKGFNIWDEEWEVGGYDNNGDTTSIQAIRSKNYISILPNTDYYFRMPNITNVTTRRLFYTINKELISSTSYPTVGAFTTPSNAYYMKFNTSTGYGTTYNNDICINVSGSDNGTYKPYVPYTQPITKQIPAEIQALAGYGVGVNENIYNYIDLMLKKYFYNAVKYNLNNINKSSFSVQTSGIADGYNYRFNVTGFKVNDMYSNTSITYNNTKTLNCGEASYDATNEIGFTFHNTEHYLILYTKTLATIDALYDYLQANDTIIIFKQKTPVETDISQYLDNNFIEVEAGGTITFTNTYNQAVPSDVDYLIEEVKA